MAVRAKFDRHPCPNLERACRDILVVAGVEASWKLAVKFGSPHQVKSPEALTKDHDNSHILFIVRT